MIYFTSDTHFCKLYDSRKKIFNNINYMHDTLIFNWNGKISNNDHIYIIGDFSNDKGYEKTQLILKNLNGNKYLIKGNNDKFVENKNFDKSIFKFIKDYYILNIEKYSSIIKKAVLFHYPILEWEGFYNNTILIHGHWHQNKKYHDRAFNVSSDINNFTPLSINEILKTAKNE